MNPVLAILVTAGVTFLLRALPMLLLKRRLTNKFLLGFFHYLPYAVISAMTIPAVFYSTGNVLTAAVGTAVACVLALLKVSLLLVIVFTVAAVYLAQFLL